MSWLISEAVDFMQSTVLLRLELNLQAGTSEKNSMIHIRYYMIHLPVEMTSKPWQHLIFIHLTSVLHVDLFLVSILWINPKYHSKSCKLEYFWLSYEIYFFCWQALFYPWSYIIMAVILYSECFVAWDHLYKYALI